MSGLHSVAELYEYTTAEHPQRIQSNRDITDNDLYRGLTVAGVAGAVGLAYGMDQNSPEANKYWAERRAYEKAERKRQQRERMREADANRKIIKQQAEDRAYQENLQRIQELRETNSRVARREADAIENALGKPKWQQRLLRAAGKIR
jgi:phage-related baseplate assembly protein